ncbi:MAG: pyruvate dehydrogenase (acetyl-transferring) E1 component subunit alpha [Dehalococcoidia bacterium]|nr:pyruvate dehydrogenase (acetyl-transferring) E1 component subunit alpha [Dehalococcoidia bacterium]
MSAETTSLDDVQALGKERLLSYLHEMVFIRRFEAKSGEMYTKGKIHGFLHLYTGQEACSVGAIHNLEDRDHVITHYRDHGHAISRGIEPKKIMAELYGKETGISHGRGGSMHLYDVSKHFWGGYAIVAAHLPLAVGLGLSSKLKHEDAVTMCIFGDGSVGEGEFHEALNLAQLWSTPVVWFCENNLYGMGVPFQQSLSTEIYKLAEAYGMPAVQIDGMDVVEVHNRVQEAVQHVREGNGPYFVEAMTYRYRGHSMADPELYRLKDEIEEYRKRDAIELLKSQLQEAGWLDEDTMSDIEERVEREVDEAVQFAEESEEPGMDTLHDHVMKERSSD